MFRSRHLPWAILGLLLACVLPVQAADIVVDTSSDGAFIPVGACKLRQAVQAANTDSAVGNCTAGDGEDRIVFDGVAAVTLQSESLTVTETLTFDGDGTLVAIRRNPDDTDVFRILDVNGSTTLTLRWIAIENGELDDPADEHGAGIHSPGLVVLEDSRISGNGALAPDSSGGGIFADEVQLLRSEVSNNTAVEEGGGIYADTITLTDGLVDANTLTGDSGRGGGAYGATLVSATRSTLSNNTAAESGGGIYADTVTLVDSLVDGNAVTTVASIGGGVNAILQFTATGSTLSDNSAGQFGGGVFSPLVSLRNSTLSGNVVEICGGGLTSFVISVQNSTITDNGAGDNATGGICAAAADEQPHSLAISNSIVYGNLGDIGTILDQVDAAGINNIIGPVGGSVTVPVDTLDCDPQLAPLADNGGPTPTHAIASDSCALDGATNPFDFPTDQRGETRTVGAGTDIGAFELQSILLFADGFED